MTTITQDFTLGEPQVAGPLAVFPVFGPQPRLTYRDFAQAVTLGALVKELDGGASVNDLLIGNPTDLPLLVYEGEEVLGAQQNRTFDVSVLLDKQSTARVPVSCVEAGRWDGSRHDERLEPSPQTADPSLRARKRARANQRALVGLEARPDQAEVWAEVSSRLDDHGVVSASAAMSDLYDSRRSQLAGLTDRFSAQPEQVGAVAFVGGRPAALDMVSRPDVFAWLLPRLAQGYALDGLRASTAQADRFEAARFLHTALSAERRPLPAVGMGHGFRVDGPVLSGSGVEHDGELVQLCVFPTEGESPEVRDESPGRAIGRPSRRRRR
jgi:hypothetical protein